MIIPQVERDVKDDVRAQGTKSETKPGYAQVYMTPELARLPGSVLKVCLALATFCTPQQPKAWPSQKLLAERMGIPEAKVRAWLVKARQAGQVTWTRKRTAKSVGRTSKAGCEYDLSDFWALATPQEEAQSKRRESLRYDGAQNSAVKAQTNSAVSSEQTRELTREPIKADRLISSESSGGTARPEVVVFLMESGKLSEKAAVAIVGEQPGWGFIEWRDCIEGYGAWLGRSGVRPENGAGHLRAFVREHGAEVVAGAQARRAEEAERRKKRQRERERTFALQRELEGRPAESVAAKARGVLEEAERSGQAVPARMRERLEAVAAEVVSP